MKPFYAFMLIELGWAAKRVSIQDAKSSVLGGPSNQCNLELKIIGVNKKNQKYKCYY